MFQAVGLESLSCIHKIKYGYFGRLYIVQHINNKYTHNVPSEVKRKILKLHGKQNKKISRYDVSDVDCIL